MHFIFICLMSFLSVLSAEIINQAVANIYVRPEEDAEIDSQVIYGGLVEVLERSSDGWSRVQTSDGFEGWMRSSQMEARPAFEASDLLRPVKNLFAHIYRSPQIEPLPSILTIPYGAQVKLLDEERSGQIGPWVPIELVSGERAWIQEGDIDFCPRLKRLEEMIALSKKFIGLPYTWGGNSTYGYDCSGFVQMLFKEMGFLLPRKSFQQSESPLLLSVDKEDLQEGDLIFLGKDKITHVGISLGGDLFIHAGIKDGPIITISTLQNKKHHFRMAKRLKPLM